MSVSCTHVSVSCLRASILLTFTAAQDSNASAIGGGIGGGVGVALSLIILVLVVICYKTKGCKGIFLYCIVNACNCPLGEHNS